MTQEELINVFKYIVKKCDILINNDAYKADTYTQDTVENIAELCNHILDGDYGKLVEAQEEPVSEDLEEAAVWYAKEEYSRKNPATLPDRCRGCYAPLIYAFKAGAKWQKEKDSILPKVWNRENLDEFSYQTAYDLSNNWMKETPTWDDVEMACKLGAKWKEEQLEKEKGRNNNGNN